MVWEAAMVKISSRVPMPPGRATKMSLWASIRSLRSLRLSHGISMSRSGKVLPPRSTSVGTTPMVLPPFAFTALPMQSIRPELQPPKTRSWPFSAIHFPISSVNVKKSGSIFLFAEQKTAIFILLYLLFDNVLSVIYRCLGKGTQKYRDYWALFADNFLILQTITNLINRKIDFLSTNYKQEDRMKRIITYSIIALLQASVALAQTPVSLAQTSPKPKLQKREKYEWQGEIPTYVETLKKELTYPMAWGNSPIRNFKKWKKAARAKVFECMMTPPKAAAAWDMEVLCEEQRDGYKAQKIAFNINAYSRITAYLLIPDGGDGKFPAVVALHDHGAHLFIGKEKMIRPFFIASEEQDTDGKISEKKKAANQEILDDADAWVNQLYEGQYVGNYLAKHGYVVLSIDAPMWGERGRKEGVDRNKYDLIAGNMMMLGRDLSAFMTYDDIASTEFLASLPMVDAKRIGCVGCSMGAYRSWMLSALSDRIKAGASICWMITTDAQLTRRFGRKENGGFANCIPGLRQYLDYPHIASLACPKPMLFINGTKDKLFPVPGVKDAFAEMHKVWKSQGADNLLDTELWEIPHSCGQKAQEKMLEFLDKNLK